jgi:ribonuclease HII
MQTTLPKKTKRTTLRSKAPRRDRETHWRQNCRVVVGIDEVGRGAWAGPLVSAAVVLPDDYRIRKVRDSKLLTPAARERLAARIHQTSLVGIGVVEVAEMNERGFSWALSEAGHRALAGLGCEPEHILLDGHFDYLAGTYPCETIVGGDGTELCIAAASVVAKVHRDARMVELAAQYPGFGFELHKGYGTAAHRAALAAQGPCAEHRADWKPIAALA